MGISMDDESLPRPVGYPQMKPNSSILLGSPNWGDKQIVGLSWSIGP